MKGFEFVFIAVGSVLGTFLRYKVTESPLLFNTLPVNVIGAFILGAFILGAFILGAFILGAFILGAFISVTTMES